MKKTFTAALLFASFAASATPALAQVYPFKPTPEAPSVAKRNLPFSSFVGVQFGGRSLRTDFYGGNLRGWADSEMALTGAYRTGDVLANVELSRFKSSVNLSALSEQSNPAWSLESVTYKAGLGFVRPWGDGEWTNQILAQMLLSTPSNGSVPYSGTPYDYNQSRYGLGVGFQAVKPFNCCLDLNFGAGLYPWMISRLDKSPYQLGWQGLAEANFGVSRHLSELLDLDLGYRGQVWGGSHLTDQNHRLMVGLSYHFLGRKED